VVSAVGRDLIPLDLAPDLDPWERQPEETARRYAQFATYRDMGRVRTLRKVAETLTLNAGYVRQVAAANRWSDRAEAFDRWRDEQHHRAWLDERRQAAERDAALLSTAVDRAADRLQTLTADDLSPRDLIRLVDVVLRHRRALYGDPQTTVAVTGPGGDPLTVQVAEFAAMGAEQRRAAIADMAVAVTRRLRALTEDDDGD
jgi:hypothetical protein